MLNILFYSTPNIDFVVSVQNYFRLYDISYNKLYFLNAKYFYSEKH